MKNIKLFDPVIDEREIKKVVKTLKSGFWASGAGGGQVHEFETKFKKFINSKSCVSVNSGTAALHLAASLCNIKGKEVILPSLSFVSTAHAIRYNGGTPVFVDVEPDTLCIDPEEIKKKISKAWCEEANIQNNPLLEIAKTVIFHEFNEMKVERPEKFGGNVSYSNYNQLETDFVEKKLHPGDLKQTVGNYLVEIISPIREKLNLSDELQETIKKSF